MSKPTSKSFDPANKPAGEQPSFEEALAQVEQIIEQIESGEVGLEKSLADYERGIKLIALCRGRLEQAQLRVADLTKTLAEVDKKSDRAADRD
jgi:exodeoxyribonuclease VII small subunit